MGAKTDSIYGKRRYISMANFAFLTFYDKICLGPRILSSTVKSAGHKSNVILFKDESFKYLFWRKNRTKINYECYINGFVKGMHYDVDPWTSEEVDHLRTLLNLPCALAVVARIYHLSNLSLVSVT